MQSLIPNTAYAQDTIFDQNDEERLKKIIGKHWVKKRNSFSGFFFSSANDKSRVSLHVV